MDLGLKGKVAIITGASKGLGRAIAEEFAKEGVGVSICARGKEDLEKAAARLRQHDVSVVAALADVTKTDDVQHVIDETIKQLGRIDVLVNNAGVPGSGIWSTPQTKTGATASRSTCTVRCALPAAWYRTCGGKEAGASSICPR